MLTSNTWLNFTKSCKKLFNKPKTMEDLKAHLLMLMQRWPMSNIALISKTQHILETAFDSEEKRERIAPSSTVPSLKITAPPTITAGLLSEHKTAS